MANINDGGPMDIGSLELGDIVLESGATLPRARLAWRSHGTLAAAKDNVVLNPTWYGGVGRDNEWLFGPGRALDPGKHFIVVPEMFGNGVSSSPSNHPSLDSWATFPRISIRDNVRMQRRLLAEVFGIDRIRLAVGWSMGAQQVFEWASLYPGQVERLAVLCGSARTSPINQVFLEGVKAALTRGTDASPHRSDLAGRAAALRAIGRVYAGWALSPAFYREALWGTLGFDSLEAFIAGFWEGMFANKDVDDLLTMLSTWQGADIAAGEPHGGDLAAALGAIRARTVVMPGRTDRYFTLEDSAHEAALVPGALFRPIESVFGHAAGVGLDAGDAAFIDAALTDILRSPSPI